VCVTFSTSEAIRGFKLALLNAEALLEDARHLLGAGRPHRAIALAVLAMEELGKLPRFYGVDRYEREGRMKRWWEMFREHTTKARMGAQFAVSAELSLAEQKKRIADLQTGKVGRDLHAAKMAALYTDFKQGKFTSPMEIPFDEAAAVANQIIAAAQATLPLHRSTAESASVEQWEEERRIADAHLRDLQTSDSEMIEAAAMGAAGLIRELKRTMRTEERGT